MAVLAVLLPVALLALILALGRLEDAMLAPSSSRGKETPPATDRSNPSVTAE